MPSKDGNIILRNMSVACGVFLLTTIWYVSHNNHGHSGINPLYMTIFFVFFLLLSIALLAKSSKNNGRLLFCLNLVTCFFGLLLPIFLVNNSILQAKSDWIHSGMPKPPEWANLFLGLYTLLYILVIMVISLAGRILREKKS